MSWKITDAVVKNVRLPTNPKMVLVTLASYADDSGRCWPSQTRISIDAGMTDRSVRNCLAVLKRENFIRIVGKMSLAHEYQLNLEAIFSEPTPERDSAPEPHFDEHTPEPRSGSTGTTFRFDRNHVPPTPEPRSYKSVIESVNESNRESVRDAREPEATTGVLVVIDQPQENFELVAQPETPEKKSRRKREPSVATKLPENWKPTKTPSDRILNLIRQWPDGMLEREFDKFLAKSEAVGRKYVDWDAAFHNWLLNADGFWKRDNANGRREQKSKSAVIDEWAANFGRRDDADGGGASDVLPLDRDQGGQLALAGPDDAWRRKGIWEKTFEDWVAEAKHHKYHFSGIRAGDEAVVRSYQKRYYPSVRFE